VVFANFEFRVQLDVSFQNDIKNAMRKQTTRSPKKKKARKKKKTEKQKRASSYLLGNLNQSTQIFLVHIRCDERMAQTVSRRHARPRIQLEALPDKVLANILQRLGLTSQLAKLAIT
jgi:hypothetical protein